MRTWNVTPLVPEAPNHLWDVLLVSGLGQGEDELHEVPVHQTAICTLCCLQSLTERGGGRQRGGGEDGKSKLVRQRGPMDGKREEQRSN